MLTGDPSSLTCAVKITIQASFPREQHSLSKWFLTVLRRNTPQPVSIKGGHRACRCFQLCLEQFPLYAADSEQHMGPFEMRQNPI